MKKLLFVLMFGLTFSQALIETREFEVFYNGNGEAIEYNLMEMFNLNGELYYYKFGGLSDISCLDNSYDLEISIYGYKLVYQFETNTYYPEEYTSSPYKWKGNIGDLIGLFDNYPYDVLDIFQSIQIEYDNLAENQNCSFTTRLWLTGKFDDNVGMEGDLNDDNGVNILDIIFLVNIILYDEGTGDINGLINAVKG